MSGWLAEATEPSRLVRYMNLEDSSEFRAGIDILEAFVGALAVLRKYQKKAVNEIDAVRFLVGGGGRWLGGGEGGGGGGNGVLEGW